MTIRLAAFLFLLTVSALLPACTNGDKSDDSGVSQIPWNKPENWESQGPMGGMMNQQGR
jgi:hypothetical protein